MCVCSEKLFYVVCKHFIAQPTPNKKKKTVKFNVVVFLFPSVPKKNYYTQGGDTVLEKVNHRKVNILLYTPFHQSVRMCVKKIVFIVCNIYLNFILDKKKNLDNYPPPHISHLFGLTLWNTLPASTSKKKKSISFRPNIPCYTTPPPPPC